MKYCRYKIGENFIFPIPNKKETKLGDILEIWEGAIARKANHLKKGNGFGYSLFDENSPYVSTLSARYYKDGAEIWVKQKDNIPRRLTPRECARLQGFSDDFKIVVSDMSAYKQFGNSVAIKVIESLAKKIIETYFTQIIKPKLVKNRIIPQISSNNESENYARLELSR
ncbi:MAG: hypothetical protein GBAus27B_000396 [Mycoplasmataceae bacterium]|nr:MAG: hypothetical protein GBAus27B_000396 [Mycoplasmataceae bacterium]